MTTALEVTGKIADQERRIALANLHRARTPQEQTIALQAAGRAAGRAVTELLAPRADTTLVEDVAARLGLSVKSPYTQPRTAGTLVPQKDPSTADRREKFGYGQELPDSLILSVERVVSFIWPSSSSQEAALRLAGRTMTIVQDSPGIWPIDLRERLRTDIEEGAIVVPDSVTPDMAVLLDASVTLAHSLSAEYFGTAITG